MSAYHTKEIQKGVYGEPSKIREELEEFEDGVLQQNKLLILCELADMIGAVEGYLDNNFPDITVEDLISMARLTKKAFIAGDRS